MPTSSTARLGLLLRYLPRDRGTLFLRLRRHRQHRGGLRRGLGQFLFRCFEPHQHLTVHQDGPEANRLQGTNRFDEVP